MSAQNATLLRHAGNTDPLTEGWLVAMTGGGTSTGAYSTGGAAAWFVSDQSNAPGSYHGYNQNLGACAAAVLAQSGWTMRVCLAINDPNLDGGATSIWFGYDTGTRRYDMRFTNTAAGGPIVMLMTGLGGTGGCGPSGFTYGVGTTGSCHVSGFHLFELVFDVAQQSATLSIDGVLTHSGYLGHPFGLGCCRRCESA